jgi:hypothetical protein
MDIAIFSCGITDANAGVEQMLRLLRLLLLPAGMLAMSTALFMASPCAAQDTGFNTTGSSNCKLADFDVSLQIISGPSNYYTLVVDKRNISNHPCVFDGQNYGPSFVPDRVPDHEPFQLCYDCENRLPDGSTPTVPPIRVNPGEAARQTIRWKTVGSADDQVCLQPDWMAGPLLIVSRRLIQPICSDIEVSRFRRVTSPDLVVLQGPTADGATNTNFLLSSSKASYDVDEWFPVHVSIAQGETVPPQEEPCPTFYMRVRSPDGGVRIDEYHPLAFFGCSEHTFGEDSGNWQSGFALDSGVNSRWGTVGDHTLQVFEITSASRDRQLQFAASNVLHVQLADPAALSRKWGPRQKGVAVDVTLDKDTFRLGEHIPLHMAVENFGATVPVLTWSALWDPGMVVGVKVLNAKGNLLPEEERFPNSSFYMGHGFGPRPLEKGRLVPLEHSLRGEGWLPKNPGTYTVVVTWCPVTSQEEHPNSMGFFYAQTEPFVTVQAQATFHVVADGSDRATGTQ